MNAFVSTVYNKKFLHIRISIEFILIYLAILFFFFSKKINYNHEDLKCFRSRHKDREVEII